MAQEIKKGIEAGFATPELAPDVGAELAESPAAVEEAPAEEVKVEFVLPDAAAPAPSIEAKVEPQEKSGAVENPLLGLAGDDEAFGRNNNLNALEQGYIKRHGGHRRITGNH